MLLSCTLLEQCRWPKVEVIVGVGWRIKVTGNSEPRFTLVLLKQSFNLSLVSSVFQTRSRGDMRWVAVLLSEIITGVRGIVC